MRVGSLCTGYGGIELGLALAGEQVELTFIAETGPAAKIYDGTDVPNLGDITALDWAAVAAQHPVDLLTAGFPCQPVSAAGRQRGETDERWLWPNVRDAIRALMPAWVLLENVRNLVSMRKGELWRGILDDLTGLRYDVRWLTLGACHVGAAHHRHRVFALATHGHPWEEPRVERVDTLPCGIKATPMLPTPAARDGDGRGEGDHAYWSTRAEVRNNGLPLGAAVALLPTPSASSYGSNQGGAAGRVGPVRHSLESLARVELLPTPTVGDSRNSRNATAGRSPDAKPANSGTTLSDVAYAEWWGRFAAAVARHEAMYGPAPAPTEPNRNGAPRLAPAFAEWLMCLPAGHVTNVLDRREALAAIGNGVCPPQLAAAWRLLTGHTAPVLDMSLGQSVASATMTTTSEQVADLDARQADARARVVAAAWTEADFPTTADYLAANAKLSAAMLELATIWREQADWWEGSTRRGRQGKAKSLRDAAGELAGFAGGLTSTIVAPEPQTEPLTADNFVPVVEAAHHQGDVPMQPMLPPVSTSPFTAPQQLGPLAEQLYDGAPAESVFATPAAPGRNRPNVKRLDFGDLGKIIADTYPVARSHMSHSYVEDMESCGLKALLSDASRHEVIGPRRPSWALVGGIAFHNAVEAIERAAIALGGSSPTDELGDWPKFWTEHLEAVVDETNLALAGTAYADTATWHVPNKGMEGFDWWRVKGAEMVSLYVKHHDDAWRAAHTLLQVPAPIGEGMQTALTPVLEFEFDRTIAGTAIQSAGRLDAAWVAHPINGQLSQYDNMAAVEIVDFKSGAREPQSTFQMAEYADILRRHYLPANFALPIYGRHYLARKGIYTPPILLDPAKTTPEIQYRYTMAERGMRNGLFLANPSSFCSGCGLVDYCPTQSKRDT